MELTETIYEVPFLVRTLLDILPLDKAVAMMMGNRKIYAAFSAQLKVSRALNLDFTSIIRIKRNASANLGRLKGAADKRREHLLQWLSVKAPNLSSLDEFETVMVLEECRSAALRFRSLVKLKVNIGNSLENLRWLHEMLDLNAASIQSLKVTGFTGWKDFMSLAKPIGTGCKKLLRVDLSGLQVEFVKNKTHKFDPIISQTEELVFEPGRLVEFRAPSFYTSPWCSRPVAPGLFFPKFQGFQDLRVFHASQSSAENEVPQTDSINEKSNALKESLEEIVMITSRHYSFFSSLNVPISIFSHFSNLRKLCIRGCCRLIGDITDFEQFSYAASGLESLEIDLSNLPKEAVWYIENFSKLRELSLSGMHKVTEWWSTLAELSSLEKMSLIFSSYAIRKNETTTLRMSSQLRTVRISSERGSKVDYSCVVFSEASRQSVVNLSLEGENYTYANIIQQFERLQVLEINEYDLMHIETTRQYLESLFGSVKLISKLIINFNNVGPSRCSSRYTRKFMDFLRGACPELQELIFNADATFDSSERRLVSLSRGLHLYAWKEIQFQVLNQAWAFAFSNQSR